VEAIAGATNELEEDKYIVRLVAMDASITDPASAHKALRSQIRRFKQQKQRVREDEPVPRPLNPFRSSKLHPSEIAIFKGLLEPGMRQLSWLAKLEPEDLRETFIVAYDDPRVERLTPEFLEDSVETLRKIQRNKKLQQSKREMQGDDRLRDIQKKLKDRQGDYNPDAS
jgi:hypothetical protein